MSPTLNRLVVAGLILGLLGSGVALGVALDRLWLRPSAIQAAKEAPRRPRPKGAARAKLLADKLKTGLDLDEAQTGLAATQIRLMFSELDAIRTRAQTDLKQVRDSRRAEILKVLLPEQQRRFKEMIDAYETRRAERLRKGRDRRR